MITVKCVNCGLVASVQDINQGGNPLSDPSICQASGPIFKCGRCGSTNIVKIDSGPGATVPATGSSTRLIKCPKCGCTFEDKPSSTQHASQAGQQQPAAQPQTSAISS